nr:hypothetical protein [Tanacetum cinerariifolium]
VPLLLTPLCYDDIHEVTPRVSALAGWYMSIPYNILEVHEDSCLCCIHNYTLIFRLRDELQYMFSYIEHMLSQPPPPNSPPPP